MKNTEGSAKSASHRVNRSPAKTMDQPVPDRVGSEIWLSGNVVPVVPGTVAGAAYTIAVP
jgi:hypothetical protein